LSARVLAIGAGGLVVGLLAACPLSAPTVGGYPIVCQKDSDCGPGTSCNFSQGSGLCLAAAVTDGGDGGPDAGDAGDVGDSGVPDASMPCAVDGTSCGFDGGNVCLGGQCVLGCALTVDGGLTAVLAGTVDPISECTWCAPDMNPDGYSPRADGMGCDADGGNLCRGGQCIAACDIDGGIVASRALDPTNPGRCCNVAASTADWTRALVKGATLATANPPLRIAAADLDQDGKVDLVVVEQGTQSQIEIFSGDGTGHFTSAALIDTGQVVADVAIGDFNGDGFPDIAALQANAHVALLINQGGDGGFDGSGSFPSLTTPTAIIAANLYADGGPPDLAVTGYLGTSPVVSVARNLSGAFGGSVLPYDVGNKPDALCSGDLDGINGEDLAVANSKDGILSVLLNNGDGTLAAGQTVALGGSPTAVASFADPSSVSRRLAATVSPIADAGYVATVERLSDGGFAMTSSVSVGPSPSAVASSDFNGDSQADLAVADSSESTLRLLFGGDGGFTVDSYTTGPDVALVIADFNGDGRPDLAVASGDLMVTIFFGQCP
jgi:hypothetical protein